MSAQLAAASSLERAPSKRKSLGPKPGSRAALGDVTGLHLNDDESEKARLRAEKSQADQPLSLSLSASTASLGAKRKSLPPLMRQNSLVTANLARPLLSAEAWRETMKLANTGKFNSKNMGVVWSNNLISDMYNLLLGPDAKKANAAAGGRSAKALFESDMDSLESGEQSNQFQKASCTLDASMMIYASRVDDVHKNTFKVLGGLSNGAVSAVVDDEDDDEASEAPAVGEDGAPLPVEKKKKSRRVLGGVGASATLEPNPSKLDTRLLETEVAPDPLFHLTTAKFEGGAGGMLMNNLSVYSGAKICLDSSEEFVLLNKPLPSTLAEREELAAQSIKAEQALRANMDFSNLAALVAEGLAAAGNRTMEELVLTARVDELIEQKAVLLGKKVAAQPEPVVVATGKKGKATAAAAAAAAAALSAAADPIDFDFAAISLPAEPEPAAMLAAADSVPMLDEHGSEVFVAETPSVGSAAAPLEVLSTQMSQVMEALEAEAALNAEMASYSAEAGAGYGEGDAEDDDDGNRSVATLTSASGASATSASTGSGLRTIEEDVATMEPAWGVLDGLADLKTNWAGIAHWKFKAKAGAGAALGGKKIKKPRAAKGTKDLLDFSGVLLSAAAPVAAVTKSSLRLADTLTNAWERTARETALRLPDDRFYRVRNLQTLCQKPGVLVKLRAPGSTKRRVIVAASSAIAAGSRRASSAEMGLDAMEDAGGFMPATPAASSSAQHAAAVEFVEPTPSAHSAVLGDMAGLVHGVGNSPLGALGAGAVDEPAMAQLQFDHADDDEHENEIGSGYGGGGGDFDADEHRGDDLAADAAGSSLIAPPARAERLEIGYARVSKKVDVKALKSSMWSGIEKGGARSFAASIHQVHRLASGELAKQLPDITPSYYFISLLHLCNEHGLTLEDTQERQKTFGDFKIILPPVQ